MKYRKGNNKIFVRLEKEESIHSNILDLINNLCIDSGFIIGIGAINSVKLGYYDIKSKEYSSKNFINDYELTSFTGNISFRNGKRFIHSHISMSDSSYKMYGGHLFEAKISAAGEFCIFPDQVSIERTYCSDIGLALWDFSDK
tara:strand:+ start:298 stop:726 length:429 start_codon:yes stop_codon:yes gene_type:complete